MGGGKLLTKNSCCLNYDYQSMINKEINLSDLNYEQLGNNIEQNINNDVIEEQVDHEIIPNQSLVKQFKDAFDNNEDFLLRRSKSMQDKNTIELMLSNKQDKENNLIENSLDYNDKDEGIKEFIKETGKKRLSVISEKILESDISMFLGNYVYKIKNKSGESQNLSKLSDSHIDLKKSSSLKIDRTKPSVSIKKLKHKTNNRFNKLYKVLSVESINSIQSIGIINNLSLNSVYINSSFKKEENINISNDLKEGKNIYILIVGPKNSGKTTFIKKLKQLNNFKNNQTIIEDKTITSIFLKYKKQKYYLNFLEEEISNKNLKNLFVEDFHIVLFMIEDLNNLSSYKDQLEFLNKRFSKYANYRLIIIANKNDKKNDLLSHHVSNEKYNNVVDVYSISVMNGSRVQEIGERIIDKYNTLSKIIYSNMTV